MAVGLLNNCESICRRVGGAADFRLKFVSSLSQVLGAREDRGSAAFQCRVNPPAIFAVERFYRDVRLSRL